MEYVAMETKSGNVIRHESFVCSKLWNYIICDKDGRTMGRITLVTRDDYKKIIDEDEEILLDTVIFHEKDRNKGLASELLDFILEAGNHEVIITSAFDNNWKNHLLKKGFILKKSLHKKRPDLLYYKKELTK